MTDPNAPRVFRLRARFIERDRLAMLSHLEVAHTLERTVRRARLPFAISQGFSPHMKIAFGAALPVGVGSTCEIFDLQLTEYVAPGKALAALQQASVPDLMVQECWYVEGKAKAASVAFPFSTYEVRFSEPVSGVEVPETITVGRKCSKSRSSCAGRSKSTARSRGSRWRRSRPARCAPTCFSSIARFPRRSFRSPA